MKYYKDATGDIHGFSAGQVEGGHVPDHLTPLTEAEEAELKTPVVVPFSEQQKQKLIEIDSAAGAARARFASPGEGIFQEYKRSYDVAKSFRDDEGYSGPVPRAVAANMRYKSIDARSAADDIIAEFEAANHEMIDGVRDLRLDGKRAVKDAIEGEDLDVIVRPFTEALNQIRPPQE